MNRGAASYYSMYESWCSFLPQHVRFSAILNDVTTWQIGEPTVVVRALPAPVFTSLLHADQGPLLISSLWFEDLQLEDFFDLTLAQVMQQGPLTGSAMMP